MQRSSPTIEAMQDQPHHTHHGCQHCLAHHSICFRIVCVVLQGESFHLAGSNAAHKQFGRFKSVGDNLLKVAFASLHFAQQLHCIEATCPFSSSFPFCPLASPQTQTHLLSATRKDRDSTGTKMELGIMHQSWIFAEDQECLDQECLDPKTIESGRS